jgi:hypothetical protein
MYWLFLLILKSLISAILIIFIKNDNTKYFIFPIIVNIIIGFLCILYFLLFYNTYTEELYKPKYYIYALVVFILILLGFYLIKITPNPAYYRAFVSLEIIFILLYFYFIGTAKISERGIAGIIMSAFGLILLSFN